MSVSTAIIRTDNAESYVRKLGQHWSHRFTVVFDGDKSSCQIELPNTLCELAAKSGALWVRLTTETDAEITRIENVVEEHINRFAFREQLEFSWVRAEAAGA